MAKTEPQLADMTYEQAFKELEGIIESLETEQKPLEESLKIYERGQLLLQYCTALLDQADLRIRQVNPATAAGE